MPAAPVTRFREVRGHERTCGVLRAALAHDRVPHALLFAGPDGVGKRGVALALAACLLCERGGDDACGECPSCRQVAAGTHSDLQMVSVAPGKKEIGIDRVREIRRFVQLQPVRGRSKIGIIDDAHMLTGAAQNALLKTLEEPPSRSVLILVANTPDAMLPTVRSRCQRLQFGPLPVERVVEVLTERGLDAAAAGELAALADGSPGRALALSDVLAGAHRAELVHALAGLGTARYGALMRLAGELAHPEGEVALKLEMLLSHYRDDAVHAVQAAAAAPSRVHAVLRRADTVNDAWHAVRRGNPNRQLLLEALLLRLARL
jgi:DNA polymerase-3 subunit delta'